SHHQGRKALDVRVCQVPTTREEGELLLLALRALQRSPALRPGFGAVLPLHPGEVPRPASAGAQPGEASQQQQQLPA
ncbi:unnamed protein product, partial [Effrenium voratum]